MARGLDPAQLEELRRIVARRLGLQLDEGKLGLLGGVAAKRLHALGDVSVDAWLLRLDARHPDEVAYLAERLTVGETYFFRNTNDLAAFAEVVLPHRAAARKNERRLRLLSAGCSSGEEAYTLAMVVRDIPSLHGWDVAVRGVDLNPLAIAKATAGRYEPWSLRQTEPGPSQRFFEASGREFRVRPEVRGMVSFEQGNLVDDTSAPWAPGAFDVVFCRNVTMYFAPEVTRRVIDRIASSLAPGGYLFLGHAETLRGTSNRFHLRHSHGTFYYQLREEGAPAEAPFAALLSASAGPGSAAANSASRGWLETIEAASERIAALTGRSAPPQAAPPAPRPAPEPAAPSREPGVLLARAHDLTRQERFAEALSLLRATPLDAESDTDALLLRAVVLTSSGAPAAAEEVCARILALDELSAEAHYLKALCREHARDLVGAADHDHYALYLDPTFAMPRLHLGLLAQRAGDREAARRELSRALVLLSAEDASRILLLGGGFVREALLALCRAELRACGGEP
ncbi:MAG TPA: CheR family methyltransferase [Anaeromyxobacteraceae bacterium]